MTAKPKLTNGNFAYSSYGGLFSIAKVTLLGQAVFHLLDPFFLYYNRRGQVTFAAGSDKTAAPALQSTQALNLSSRTDLY